MRQYFIDGDKFPETAKFLNWFENAQENGLKDIKFCTFGVDKDQMTFEEFFAEVNKMNAASDIFDGDVF